MVPFPTTTPEEAAVPGEERPRSRRLRRVGAALSVLVALALVAHASPALLGTTHLVHEVTIARAPADVFAYVTTPGHWPEWHPSSLGVSGATDHPLGLGEESTERFVVAGRHGEARWKVVGIDPPRRWAIEGVPIDRNGREAAGGAMITYTLVPEGDGTRFRRNMDYRMPNLWADLLNVALGRARIADESAEALRRLKAVLENDVGAR